MTSPRTTPPGMTPHGRTTAPALTRPRAVIASALMLGVLALSGCGSEQESASEPPSASAGTGAPGGAAEPGTSTGADGGGQAAAPAEADVDSASSTDVVVNKQRPLDPQDHAPAPLVDVEGQLLRDDAAAAAAEMLADMRAEGITVSITSAYRSYDEQVGTYQHWVDVNGQETADTISARPGHSEHQTGLALDLADGTGCDLQACFAETPAAQWALEHGPEHGFVLRYPEGAEGITGYAYEPWHLRYVGPERAQQFADSGAAALEEFYGTGPAPDYS